MAADESATILAHYKRPSVRSNVPMFRLTCAFRLSPPTLSDGVLRVPGPSEVSVPSLTEELPSPSAFTFEAGIVAPSLSHLYCSLGGFGINYLGMPSA